MEHSEGYEYFVRKDTDKSAGVVEARALAIQVLNILKRSDVVAAISAAHHVGASSHSIQSSILKDMEILGFTSERKGLFADFKVPGIRPDYFKPLTEGGILFEVERGKTIANNMDLLDVWKTHICKDANHLFLLVPRVRRTHKGTEQRIFNTVVNRVGTFFAEGVTQVDVNSVHIFGY